MYNCAGITINKKQRTGSVAIYSELPVYRDSYRLLLEIYKVTNTFSREYKFSLGQDMRRDTLSLFRNLYRANKNQDKREFLDAFLDDFELLKLQIRVCLDLKLLSYNNKNNNNRVRCVLALGSKVKKAAFFAGIRAVTAVRSEHVLFSKGLPTAAKRGC